MNEIIIYADGACRGNGKANNVGAWAYKLMFNDSIKTGAQAVRDTTNNKMELLAVINALKVLKPAAVNFPVNIFTDSQYVVNGMTNWIVGWQLRGWRDVKNSDLWKELLELKNKFPSITFSWVKGHSHNIHNCDVDLLCNKAMDELNS